MNTTTYGPTAQQRETALQIWTDLEEWNRAFEMSDRDFYAVWGLANAILNVKDRDSHTYDKWMNTLYEVWSEVKASYSA